MKKFVILFVTLLLVCVISMSSLISVYAYCDEENTTTDETNVTTEEENSAYSSRSSIVEGGEEINGELWYGIEMDTENNKPIITYDIDYSDSHLLDYLKPGDIIFERNAGLDVVDFLGHIAMVVEVVPKTPTQQGYVLMIESLPSVINNPYTGEPRELGVCYSIMTPTRFDVKQVSIMRVKNATDAQIQGAINWAVSRFGKAWRVPANKYIDDKKNWYCSELVWAAYCLQGIDLVENNILPVPPEEIYESDEVVTILDYRANVDPDDYYDTTFIEKTNTHHTYSCSGDTYTEAHDYEVYNYCYEKCRACGYQRQAQEHEYTYRYNSLNSTTHYAYCECGARKGESHVFNVVGKYKICEECNYTIEANHVHSYTYTPLLKGKSHRKECSCGDSVIEGCSGQAMVGEDAVCRWCGETIKSGQGLLSLENEDALPNSKEDDEKVE